MSCHPVLAQVMRARLVESEKGLAESLAPAGNWAHARYADAARPGAPVGGGLGPPTVPGKRRAQPPGTGQFQPACSADPKDPFSAASGLTALALRRGESFGGPNA